MGKKIIINSINEILNNSDDLSPPESVTLNYIKDCLEVDMNPIADFHEIIIDDRKYSDIVFASVVAKFRGKNENNGMCRLKKDTIRILMKEFQRTSLVPVIKHELIGFSVRIVFVEPICVFTKSREIDLLMFSCGDSKVITASSLDDTILDTICKSAGYVGSNMHYFSSELRKMIKNNVMSIKTKVCKAYINVMNTYADFSIFNLSEMIIEDILKIHVSEDFLRM